MAQGDPGSEHQAGLRSEGRYGTLTVGERCGVMLRGVKPPA